MHQNIFYSELDTKISEYSGLHNGHAHIDRFATARPQFYGQSMGYKQLQTIRLWDKQSATTLLHQGVAYEPGSLHKRMSRFLEESSQLGVARIDSFIDVAHDIPLDNGLGALLIAKELKRDFKDCIDLRLGAYPLFGFKGNEPERWSLFLKAVELADFIGTSPERDDPLFYRADRSHIGLERHFLQTLEVALKHGKPIHYHLDQQVNPHESATETLVHVIKHAPFSEELVRAGQLEPLVWAVHTISPTTYDSVRLKDLLDSMAALNIGVVSCPSAALSMRRVRDYVAPINKSMAEVLLMIDCGVSVRIGTDNVDDVFLPSTTLDLRNEIGYLSNALRFYHTAILAKLACGRALDGDDRKIVQEYLEEEERFMERYCRLPDSG